MAESLRKKNFPDTLTLDQIRGINGINGINSDTEQTDKKLEKFTTDSTNPPKRRRSNSDPSSNNSLSSNPSNKSHTNDDIKQDNSLENLPQLKNQPRKPQPQKQKPNVPFNLKVKADQQYIQEQLVLGNHSPAMAAQALNIGLEGRNEQQLQQIFIQKPSAFDSILEIFGVTTLNAFIQGINNQSIDKNIASQMLANSPAARAELLSLYGNNVETLKKASSALELLVTCTETIMYQAKEKKGDVNFDDVNFAGVNCEENASIEKALEANAVHFDDDTQNIDINDKSSLYDAKAVVQTITLLINNNHFESALAVYQAVQPYLEDQKFDLQSLLENNKNLHQYIAFQSQQLQVLQQLYTLAGIGDQFLKTVFFDHLAQEDFESFQNSVSKLSINDLKHMQKDLDDKAKLQASKEIIIFYKDIIEGELRLKHLDAVMRKEIKKEKGSKFTERHAEYKILKNLLVQLVAAGVNGKVLLSTKEIAALNGAQKTKVWSSDKKESKSTKLLKNSFKNNIELTKNGEKQVQVSKPKTAGFLKFRAKLVQKQQLKQQEKLANKQVLNEGMIVFDRIKPPTNLEPSLHLAQPKASRNNKLYQKSYQDKVESHLTEISSNKLGDDAKVIQQYQKMLKNQNKFAPKKSYKMDNNNDEIFNIVELDADSYNEQKSPVPSNPPAFVNKKVNKPANKSRIIDVGHPLSAYQIDGETRLLEDSDDEPMITSNNEKDNKIEHSRKKSDVPVFNITTEKFDSLDAYKKMRNRCVEEVETNMVLLPKINKQFSYLVKDTKLKEETIKQLTQHCSELYQVMKKQFGKQAKPMFTLLRVNEQAKDALKKKQLPSSDKGEYLFIYNGAMKTQYLWNSDQGYFKEVRGYDLTKALSKKKQ